MSDFIFVSYAHKDRHVDQVLKTIQFLRSSGFNVWYDDGIDPGTEWDDIIAHHIETCAYLFSFVSTAYMESDNCRDELNYARDIKKRMLLIYLEPVELSGGMKMRMNRLQAIHKYKYSSFEAFERKLLATEGLSELKPVVPVIAQIPPLIPVTPCDIPKTRNYENALLGGFHLKKRIGFGNNGQVYKAESVGDIAFESKDLCVKILDCQYFDPGRIPYNRDRTLFAELQQITQKECFPTLYSIHSGTETDPVYVVMDHIKGKTLSEYLNIPRPFTQILPLFRYILVSLLPLHDHGIYHGNLLGSNIIIKDTIWEISQNDQNDVCIIDFSTANYIGTKIDTNQTVLMDTPPEISYRDFADQKTDIYSAGCLLGRMITQSTWFNPGTDIEKVKDALKPQADFYMYGIVKIIEKATQRCPEDRYLTLRAMIRDINELLAVMKKNGLRPVPVDPTPIWFRKNLRPYLPCLTAQDDAIIEITTCDTSTDNSLNEALMQFIPTLEKYHHVQIDLQSIKEISSTGMLKNALHKPFNNIILAIEQACFQKNRNAPGLRTFREQESELIAAAEKSYKYWENKKRNALDTEIQKCEEMQKAALDEAENQIKELIVETDYLPLTVSEIMAVLAN